MNSVNAVHITFDLAVADLDHPAWVNAKPIEINRYWSSEFAPPGRHAEARILWSHYSLLVRFTCPQFEPLIISPAPQTAQKTLGLWDRDVCEIFLAPDPE